MADLPSMNTAIKLLLVEDEPDLRDILSEELGALNFEIVTAKSGKDGLSMIQSDSAIAAVISDIKMPEMSGIEFLQKTRSLGVEVPFVFLTGFADKMILTEALQLGAIDCLDKPYKPDALLSSVREALRFGVTLKGIRSEYDRLFEKYEITPEDQKKIRDLQTRVFEARFGSK